MRITQWVVALVASVACLAAACSDGVTPTCGPDAGCGAKPAPDGGTANAP